MSDSTSSSSLQSITNVSPSTALIGIGLLLFVVPEPITSILGALVVLVGIGAWVLGSLL